MQYVSKYYVLLSYFEAERITSVEKTGIKICANTVVCEGGSGSNLYD